MENGKLKSQVFSLCENLNIGLIFRQNTEILNF